MSSSSKPIDIEDFNTAIQDLADANLFSLKHQLENSISKLEETNAILKEEIETVTNELKESHTPERTEEREGDLSLFKESIDENKSVLKNQGERLKSLNSELARRGLLKEVKNDDSKLSEAPKHEQKEEQGIFL